MVENIKTKYRYGQKVMIRSGFFYSGYKGVILSALRTEDEIDYKLKLEGVREDITVSERDIFPYKKYIFF